MEVNLRDRYVEARQKLVDAHEQLKKIVQHARTILSGVQRRLDQVSPGHSPIALDEWPSPEAMKKAVVAVEASTHEVRNLWGQLPETTRANLAPPELQRPDKP